MVAAGTLDQLAALAAGHPAVPGLSPLQVAGAFHTHHMAPAVEVLGQLAAALTPSDPESRCCPTPTAPRSRDGCEVLARLVSQISPPVAVGPVHVAP